MNGISTTPGSIAPVSPFRSRVLIGYVTAILLGIVAAIVLLLVRKPLYYGAAVLAAPVVFIIVTHPKLALFQFVFCIFIEFPVLPSVPLYLIDLSAMLVVAAAAIDLLTDDKLPTRLPPMTFNYLYLFAALIVTGVLGYFPSLLPIRLATMTLLITAFLGIYRLLSRTSLGEVINWFFWIGVAHSVYVLVPFVVAHGLYRSFGFSGVLFDDLAMATLPLGLALYLGASRNRALMYLFGCFAVAGGLVATQSRLSILFGMFLSLVVLVVAYRRARGSSLGEETRKQVRARIKILVAVSVAGGVVLVLLAGGLLTGLTQRFEQLENPLAKYSTARYRIVLWKRAIRVFLDHPLIGLGPGGYYNMNKVYTTEHLTPMWYYFRTLGAHNMLLHYLAMTGLVGGLGVLALVGNTFRHARRVWRHVSGENRFAVSLALYAWATMFLVTTLIEANWMWGQLSFLAVFLVALIAEQSTRSEQVA